RIAGHQEQLRLVRSQRFRWYRAGRPPPEATFRQALRGKPESLRVICQYPDRLSAPAAEDKQAARKGIGIQFLAAKLSQGINALPAVDRLDRHQYAHLWRDLDQDATSHNARLSPARSDAEAPFNWIRTVPRRPYSSIVHSGTEI